jgi:hypothetical protein
VNTFEFGLHHTACPEPHRHNFLDVLFDHFKKSMIVHGVTFPVPLYTQEYESLDQIRIRPGMAGGQGTVSGTWRQDT